MSITFLQLIAHTPVESTMPLRLRVLRRRRGYILVSAMLACLLAFSLAGNGRHVTAQAGFPDPNANCPHAACGEVSPLIPMQSTEAVHMGLIWKRNSKTPKILFHARFPEYTPNDMADPAFIDLAIARRILVCAEAGGRKHYR